MDRAIFKIYNKRKFAIGVWVRYNGGVNYDEFFAQVLKKIKPTDNASVDMFMNFKSIENQDDLTRYLIKWNKRKPFEVQMEGETSSLYWFENIKPSRLEDNYIFGKYKYTIKMNDNELSVSIEYEGREETFKSSYEGIDNLIFEIQKWVRAIDNELADCDCFDKIK